MELLKEKQTLFRALTGLVAIATVALIYMVLWGALLPQEQYPARNISVSATGEVIAKPDIALVSFSIISEGKDTKVISDENNTQMQKAIDFLKEQGIDEKDIKTTEYNLSPVYSQPSPMSSMAFRPTIVSYSLTQTAQVKIRDFSKISDLIAQLAPLGVNRVSTVTFGIDDPEVYRATARAEAIEKAKEKAKIMAKDLGVSLGKVVSVSEYAQDSDIAYRAVKSVSGYGGMEIAPQAVPASIEAGSQEVIVNANITFEIK
jgi:hypothetical protein